MLPTGYFLTRIEMIKYHFEDEAKTQKKVTIMCTLDCNDAAATLTSVPHFTLTFNYNTKEDRADVEKILCKCTTSNGHDYYDFKLTKTETFHKVLGDRIDVDKVIRAVDEKGDVYLWIKRSYTKNPFSDSPKKCETLMPVSVDDLPDDVYYKVFPKENK